MPIPACCIKGKFKSALLYSKGGLYASDVGIKLPHVYDLAFSIKGEILCQGNEITVIIKWGILNLHSCPGLAGTVPKFGPMSRFG